MTYSEFELFDIQCRDFIRNLCFFQRDSRDEYVRATLEELITYVQRYRRVIEDSVDESTV